ncbi:MAG TPA: NADH-quinone oxidoreductase subunit NuoG [candidate division Zixibacteria bacterium]|nr:NADH-quinone oxidoreductase subunit NuoG [candidate division Zixibacteria bacterium]MDD4917026.1 NADH-quinone oxidoreductase subunit NuoG [candidate division Zixibacteria bacterium]MDM7971434.1 NADH-quinone oxidoreductase subunit NuoG [candidate division Zixibacteria bacterium]HOD66643.1 NADH-quinone oxidoreductase subunit NuoG [candidate division Zixibacteria bacterium]HOZ07663.1 NADH-quinone oxidoreductase subunit NuoG [candidate division Zixibacteria bacterium]
MAQDVKDTQPQKKAEIPTVTLTIDGRPVTVPRGTTVLEAARQMGIHIPTFCWHPKLKPVGACRICYVEIEKFPKLMVSCATEATEGMIVHTDSDLVKQGRKAVLEFILLNHPLDCPTCDKGGECDLQNLTFRHGYDDSRFEFQKYRFTSGAEGSTFDDKRIGPEIILNRNRCILCFKCVRANKEAFGEYDLGAYERGYITEIDAAPGEQVDNPFSGNLVEICPVGALTNTDWRYKIRVWLTQTTPSICNFSATGANLLFYKEDHKNRIYRVTSRRNDGVDDGWLADITRYGYQIAHSEERLHTPLVRRDGKQVPASWEEALEVIRKRFGEITETKGRVCIGGLAAPHLDNAALYAFSKLFRTVLKSNNVDYRSDYRMLPSAADSPFNLLCRRPFRIADIDASDVIVTLGSDLLREHQLEYVRIRKACTFRGARYFSMTPYAVRSADIAEAELVYAVGMEEVLLTALGLAAVDMGLVDPSAGAVFRARVEPKTLAEACRLCGVAAETVKLAARALATAGRVTFFTGEIVTRSYARDAIGAAALNLDRLLGLHRRGQIAALARYANSAGAERLGVSPTPAPAVAKRLAELWGEFPEAEPGTTDRMMVQMRRDEIDGFFILGANPVMLYPDRQFALESLEKLDFLVAADLFETPTTELADVVLPLASWAEFTGDYVNLEGRVQRAERAIKPLHQAKPPLEIVRLVADKLGGKLFASEEQMQAEIDAVLAVDATAAPSGEFFEVKPAAEPASEEYPLPLFMGDDPHHSGHLTEKSVALANFCSEAYLEMSPELARRYGLDEGDPVRIESELGKVVAPARISDVLDSDVLLAPRNFASTPVNSLLTRKRRIDRVKISKVID